MPREKAPASKSKTAPKKETKSIPAASFVTESKYEKYLKQDLKNVEAQIKQLMRHKTFLMKELGIPEEK